MRALCVDSKGQATEKDLTFEQMQQEVGGYVERVSLRLVPVPPGETRVVMLVNEEGRLCGLPSNWIGSVLYGTPIHGEPVVGNIVLVGEGVVDGEPDFVDLPGWFDLDAEVQVIEDRTRRLS